MEMWTFINKLTNEIVRCDALSSDAEFGNIYYFTDCIYSPYWFVDSEEKATLAYVDGYVHEQYSNNYERPKTDRINIKDYEIVTFKNK